MVVRECLCRFHYFHLDFCFSLLLGGVGGNIRVIFCGEGGGFINNKNNKE